MTRIDFHFNVPDKLGYGCRLVRKIYRTGQRVVVCCDDPARLAAFDQALWTFAPQDFVPHVMAGDPLADETPIVLAVSPDGLPWHDVLVNLGDATPEGFARFERLVEVVADDPADRDSGRARWRFYRDRGYPLDTHDAAAERR
ncbi:MAG TPA: DNA polymerase III subunit chi [Burkholderiaceae bacterium]|nr:DNA polymerase III subunit chi [Burkholderiaceae bacterium]